MPHPPIVAVSSIREYFQETVHMALKQQAYAPSEAASSYLVDLLCEQTRNTEGGPSEALAPAMVEAQTSLPTQSVRKLKKVGDQSLYVAGFFSDSLRRAQLDPDYYVILGSKAYRQLSHLLRRLGSGTTLVVVYSELGQEFARFVQVLSEVKTMAGLGGQETEDLGELYEEWLRTGSETIAKKLQAAGFIVLRRVTLH